MLSEKLKTAVLILLLTLAVAAIQGQQPGLTEDDVIARAENLFEEKNWEEALPLYAQLVSVYPDKAEYNYKFGVCTLMGNRSDKRRPVRYLSIAYRSMPDNKDLLYYLGLAYYYNEEFANAMKFFNLYLAKLDANSPDRPRILEQVNACLNGMNLEHKNMVNEVLSKNEFQTDNFHRAYRADELDGDLILKPENFMTPAEKNAGTNSFVYVSEPRGILYYSGYADNGSRQRDIFKVALKDNGKWGEPEKLSDKVNTAFDEDYPVISDGGSTLYFSSKGHNSLGGYDIYKSALDPATQEFGAPENMGKGVNSPFDDILFVPDNSGNGAYFASNRENLGNNISVYRVRMNNEGFADQQMLARQSIQTKIENATGNADPTAVAANTSASTAGQQQAAVTPQVDPQQKAADLVQQRNMADKLADTAFLMVTNMKSLIRDLTNKRDRANMISGNKSEKAKGLEAEYDLLISSLPAAPSKESFEEQLGRALELKKEIYQYRQRADQANLIARNLGKHLKIKNEELKQLKLDAGEVQSLSVKGEYAQTEQVFSKLKLAYMKADTLSEYAENINWINTDKVVFDVPGTELAFAEKMREGYENQTLLAMTQAKEGALAKFDETVPINVVDNRTGAAVPEKQVMEAAPVIQQVLLAGAAKIGSMPVEDELEINFDIDAVKPYDLIAPVEVPAFAFNEPAQEEVLEVNFNADAIEALKQVETVMYDQNALAMADEPELELDFDVDRIEPEALVQQVRYDETLYAAGIGAEDLEIRNDVDRIEAEELVQPVAFDMSYALNIEEEIEINNQADRIEAEKLVSPVDVSEAAFAAADLEEELEINTGIDRITPEPVAEAIAYNVENDLVVDENLEITIEKDSPAPAPLVEPVVFMAAASEVEQEDLELGFSVDAVEPLRQVEQIAYSETGSAMDEDELEISADRDVKTYAMVDPVLYNENDFMMLPEDEFLEINFASDLAKILKMVNPVELVFSEMQQLPEEELEIRLEQLPAVEVADVVDPVMLAQSDGDLNIPEEDLEIVPDQDAVEPAPLVEKVSYALADENTVPEESLEVRIEPEALVPVAQVATVDVKSIDRAKLEMIEEELDVTFDADAAEAIAQVEPVVFDAQQLQLNEDLEIRVEEEAVPEVEIIAQVSEVHFTPSAMANAGSEDLEIGFSVDGPDFIEPAQQVEPVRYSLVAYSLEDLDELLEITFNIDTQAQDKLMADNAGISSMDMAGVTGLPEAGTELFYLRESLSMAADIETSRTDMEIVRIAIENPEDLSYEELLFAASLAPVPEDKLKIYNFAFIHIDRDWRAFNNAAVTAMNMKDLDQAEVYLYQASLISSDNGKVENNMGILACYKSDFISAETHFLTASQLGVNSEYNLQLVRNLSTSKRVKSN